MKLFLSCAAAIVILLICCTGPELITKNKIVFPSYDPSFPPPPNTKDVFELSQDYPDTFNVNEAHPWTSIDFKSDYTAYMKTVLKYCLEGNTEPDVDFKVQKNKKRKWYHAPWLHYGMNGREYHHGLTRERNVPPFEMHKDQDIGLENWAVGFYNEPGGYTFGKVWETDSVPRIELSDFPEGTVTFKLLFTAGTADKVPFIKGSKEWTANIYPCDPDTNVPCRSTRIDSTVRLIQLDIAVKDKRAGATGWVMGTFIYDASQPGNNVWDKMVPVGLMWGDDSNVSTLINKEGAFINPDLKQTVLNESLIPGTNNVKPNQAYLTHQGLGGRLNGPVDNPISSCISCHGRGAVTKTGKPDTMANFKLTRKTFTIPAFEKFFATIPGGAGPIKIGATVYYKLDYSMQMTAGIRNFYQARIDEKKRNKNLSPQQLEELQDLPDVTRGGLKPNDR
jgi:hypothetical protein